MYAEIAAEPVHRFWIESHVYWHDVSVSSDRHKQGLTIAALEFESHLGVGRGSGPHTRYRSGNPDLIGGVPELPDAIPERALGSEIVPFTIDELVRFVLDAKRRCGILHVLIERQDEVGRTRIIAQPLPP